MAACRSIANTYLDAGRESPREQHHHCVQGIICRTFREQTEIYFAGRGGEKHSESLTKTHGIKHLDSALFKAFIK